MNDIRLEKKIKRMLSLPIWFGLVILIMGFVGHVIEPKFDVAYASIVAVYVIAAIAFYLGSAYFLRRQMVEFGIGYGVLQKEILSSLDTPYALLDQDAKILWVNKAFAKLTEKDKSYHKGICTIFPDINKDWLSKIEGSNSKKSVRYDDKHFKVDVQKLTFGDLLSESGVTEKEITEVFYSVSFYEDTELVRAKKKVKDQRLVAGLVYIDNYEDALNSIEDVQRSMLTAIIDRKVNEYFSQADALVRKLEKDRYFVIFRQKYLESFREDHYSILEDIKTAKVGNEMDVTLSIGLGIDGETYAKTYEYAKAAIDLALGRGGSQVVEKHGEEINFYGGLSHGTEKNTRVRARVKAQALRELILSHDGLVIMGHRIQDPDALGSAIGISAAAKALGKTAHICLNEVTFTLKPLKEMFTVEKGYPEDLFVNNAKIKDYVTSRTLIMVVDTNRPTQVECPDLLSMGRNVAVFDHHRQSADVIENPVLSYVEPFSSSTCEMVSEVIQYFPEEIKLTPEEADCMYAGMIVDTDNFLTKTGVRTFEAAAFLRRSGADSGRVRKVLRDDMDAYKARAEVVRHAEVFKNCFAISVCTSTDVQSPTVIGAQAANELLKISGIKASFVLTRYQESIYVSARSIDEINVQIIMEKMGGGGHLSVAGAQLKNTSLEETKKMIENVLSSMIEEGEITV